MGCDCLPTTRNVFSTAYGKSVICCSTKILPSSSTTYSPGYVVGTAGAVALIEFKCAVAGSGRSSELIKLDLVEKASTGSTKNFAFDVVFLSGGASPLNDNQAFTSSQNLIDSNHGLGVISIASGDYKRVGTGTDIALVRKTTADFGAFPVANQNFIDSSLAGGTSVYAYIIFTGSAAAYSGTPSLALRAWFHRH